VKKARAEPGHEYKSKKAGGDVWKKGMLEPHAYIPLDARLLNKKNRREAVGYFGGVVESKSAVKARAALKKAGGRPGITHGSRSQRIAAKKNRGKG